MIQSKLASVAGVVDLEEFPESISSVEAEITKAIKVYDDQLADLKLEQSHLQLTQKLDEFAKGLTDEKECPLCGSVHHPNIYSAESVSEELQQIQFKTEDLDKKKSFLNTSLISLSGAYSTYATYSSQLIQKQDDLEKLRSELEHLQCSFDFIGYTPQDEANVKGQLAGFEQKNNGLKKLRTSAASLRQKTNEANKNIIKIQKRC